LNGKLRNFINNTILLLLSTIVGVCFLEVLLREFPRFMPYPKTWNYIHHYQDLSRLFRKSSAYYSSSPSIVAIGDSFTRGAEVAPKKDWVSILNREYGYNIFNLAVGGSSTIEQWVLLKNFIFPKSVKHVLLAIYRNDIEQNLSDLIRHEKEGDGPFFRRANKSSDIGFYDTCINEKWYMLFKLQKSTSSSNQFFPVCLYFKSYLFSSIYDTYRMITEGDSFQKTIDIKALNLFFDAISKRYISKNIKLSEFKSFESWLKKNTKGISSTLLILKKIQDKLASKNISLEVVYLPSNEEIYYSDWAKSKKVIVAPNFSAGSVLESHSLDLGLHFKNLTPSLRKYRKLRAPLFLPFDSHPSEQGHKMIAELINNFLKSRDIK
jgi:hypothetical protein